VLRDDLEVTLTPAPERTRQEPASRCLRNLGIESPTTNPDFAAGTVAVEVEDFVIPSPAPRRTKSLPAPAPLRGAVAVFLNVDGHGSRYGLR